MEFAESIPRKYTIEFPLRTALALGAAEVRLSRELALITVESKADEQAPTLALLGNLSLLNPAANPEIRTSLRLTTAGFFDGRSEDSAADAALLVESAVGAHLVNAAAVGECEVFYWRERNVEVDFVTRHGQALTALEVKSGRASAARSGLQVFSELFKPQRQLPVGGDGISLESFLSRPAEFWTKRGPNS